MSVEVTFQPAGLSGLVAKDTYVIAAARQMGLRLRADCCERGECTSCVVAIVTGQSLCSAPTEAERELLGVDRLAQEQRLACQVKMEVVGEVVVRLMPDAHETSQEKKNVKQAFAELSLTKKLATLVQLEALTLTETVDTVVDRSLSAAAKVLDRFLAKPTSTSSHKTKRK